MKFRCLCLALLIPLLCCCCSRSGRKVVPITRDISFYMGVKYYNESYSCKVNVDKNADMIFTVTSPEDLRGLVFKFSGNEVTAEYMGLTYKPKMKLLPVGNVTQTVHDILKSIDNSNEMAVYKNENCMLAGKSSGREYTFYFSPSGLPLLLKIPDKSFQVEFANVTIEKESAS